MKQGSTVLITGGTGMIGQALTKALLEKDYQIIILSRDPATQSDMGPRVRYMEWNVEEQTIDSDAIAGADHIIHLAGAGIADKRWSKKRKEEIRNSRINGTNLIGESLKRIPNQVSTLISASAIGWYGEDEPQVRGKKNYNEFEESDTAADNFLGQTCKEWEDSVDHIIQPGLRVVKLRTGIVLSRDGGALPEFLKPLRFGLATILGGGKQIVSWIHIVDLVRLYMTGLENEKWEGVYNAVAPQPVSNRELVLQLAKLKRGKFYIPLHVPAFVLRIVLGEMSIEVLKSCTVSCSKVHFERFTFLYPSIQAAFAELIPAN